MMIPIWDWMTYEDLLRIALVGVVCVMQLIVIEGKRRRHER